MQQIKSLGSAKIISLNKEIVLREIKKISEKIKEEEKGNILDIIIFGSIAKNNYTGTSDVDIVIILKESDLNFIERIIKYRKYFDLDIGVDVFVYTFSEFEKMKRENNFFIKEIIDFGISVLKK